MVTEWAQGFTKVVALDDASLDHLLEQYCFNDIDDAIDRCVAISPIVARLTREAA